MSNLCPVAAPVSAINLEDQPKTVGGSLLGLLQSKKHCDVTFTFPNLPDRLEAHMVILGARSPMFEEVFEVRKSENIQGNEIEISNCTPKRFQQFIEFIYSDKFDVDTTGALDLLKLSYEYLVQPLTLKCEELLQSDIQAMGSVKVFETARRYYRRDSMGRVGPSMVKSFLELVGTGEMLNVEEETLVYLLECDDLAVKEVGLFQFILDWGRNQVGTSADGELLRSKLKNLISKIRYTNMDPHEFTKVVVPTGLLSAEESLSVHSFLCGDDITRRDLKIKFNTSLRKVDTPAVVSTLLEFDVDLSFSTYDYFPAFSKHCASFQVYRTQVDGQVLPDNFLKKTVITKVLFKSPCVESQNKNHVINMNVSIGDYAGPVQAGRFTIRFQKALLNLKNLSFLNSKGRHEVTVEPPLELMFGRTYSIIVENLSTVDLADSFRVDPKAYFGPKVSNTSREAHIDSEEVRVTLKEIHRKTEYYAQELPDFSQELFLIRGVEIGLQ